MTALRAVVLVLVIALSPAVARADPSAPWADEIRQPPSVPSADTEYHWGIRARVAKNWTEAADAFRRALAVQPGSADAWNELGFALRNQGRYAESLDAYGEALRLRPEFPEALEYLGEAYVKMGRLEDARRVLDRLRVLDTARAQELAEEIQNAK